MAKKYPTKTIKYSPEIIIGLVAGVGTDLKKVMSLLAIAKIHHVRKKAPKETLQCQ